MLGILAIFSEGASDDVVDVRRSIGAATDVDSAWSSVVEEKNKKLVAIQLPVLRETQKQALIPLETQFLSGADPWDKRFIVLWRDETKADEIHWRVDDGNRKLVLAKHQFVSGHPQMVGGIVFFGQKQVIRCGEHEKDPSVRWAKAGSSVG